MKSKLSIFFVFFIQLVYSQDTIQLVKGRVTDKNTSNPVNNAAIFFKGIQNYTFTSDSNGFYSGIVFPGNYVIHVHKTGYKDQTRDNIIVFSGKQNIQDFEVTSFRIELDSVQIVADNNSEHVELDLWNIQRFAAVFYDPARAANFHAGVVNTDDQANNVSVHGTSPNFIQWKIEGVEVVNPNHLENAGTLNDRPTLNGGGVSLFSAQLLQNSNFMFSPFNSTYGNALSGAFDMKLRNGNPDDYEHTIQASLMGLDFSMEGPFTKRNRSSFLFNYRYSTVGLLSKMGVSFGGEMINYQDLSFVLTFPHKNGVLKLFSIIGESENKFRGKTDSTELEFQKDLLDIDYRSLTTISGLNYIHTLSSSLYLRTIASYSNKSVRRNSQPTGLTYRNFVSELDRYEQQKFSGATYLSKQLGRELSLKGGSYYNYFIYGQEYRIDDVAVSKGSIEEPLIQPFVSLDGVFKRIEFHAGVHSLYQMRISDLTILPKASVKLIFSNSHDIMLKYGREAQLQPFLIYLGTLQNRSLKPTISNGLSLVHHFNILKLDVKTELYYTQFERIPVNVTNGFSAFNYFNEQVLFSLEQSGKAQTYGVDLTLEKNIKQFYMILSTGLFNSTYSMNTNYYKSRFNCNYNVAVTVGKEYTLKNKRKMISTDLRGFIRDGFRESSGTITNNEIYNTSLPSYYRVDLRLSYRKNKLKSSVIWALDIQNLTNTKNISYHYFDLYTGKIEAKEQLGLIPVISYKVFF